MISKGYLYHILRFQFLDSEILLIESVSAVRKFPEVFPNDLPGIPSEREIDFGINFLPDTKSI